MRQLVRPAAEAALWMLHRPGHQTRPHSLRLAGRQNLDGEGCCSLAEGSGARKRRTDERSRLFLWLHAQELLGLSKWVQLLAKCGPAHLAGCQEGNYAFAAGRGWQRGAQERQPASNDGGTGPHRVWCRKA